jgi:two-component system nitrogen regulation response regulator GlnG
MTRSPNRAENVWIVDDDRSIRWVLEKALQQEGMEPVSFDSADAALVRLQRQCPDVLISDIRMPGTSGLDLLASIRERYPKLPVIIMTAHSDLDSAVASYQGGAFEYLPKPFDVDEAVALVRRALAHSHEQEPEEEELDQPRTPEIIGEAPAMQEVFRAIGLFKAATTLHAGAGKGPFFVTKQLRLHQIFGNGGHVERDERIACARAVAMQSMRDQFFTGA